MSLMSTDRFSFGDRKGRNSNIGEPLLSLFKPQKLSTSKQAVDNLCLDIQDDSRSNVFNSCPESTTRSRSIIQQLASLTLAIFWTLKEHIAICHINVAD